ncbi:MAG: (Fe-S)-binding protein [Bryobacterales bacterium]|nr:(Fe-S)-binding protein [Bryobacterales bacterium]
MPSELAVPVDAPQEADLRKCVHCGLCLNACPTYRELGVEMDSPRGRIYQMVEVAEGRSPVSEDYIEHIELCLACRSCETACPSGVQYGRLIEGALAQIETATRRSVPQRLVRWFAYSWLLRSRLLLRAVGLGLLAYQRSGLDQMMRESGFLDSLGRLGELAQLAPQSQAPFFFSSIGKVFPAEGVTKHRVALMAGCMQNVFFSRLNEATVRVLCKNGCEVTVPAEQECCGALQVHAGLRMIGREQAKKNIAALEPGGFDAIITNTAGCGSVLKEYPELFEHDPEWHERARAFAGKMRDVSEFLASVDLNTEFGRLERTVTYQDSCHLLHGQKISTPPRQMIQAIPGVKLHELPMSEICCGSAGVYNVEHTDISMSLLEDKMRMIESTRADTIVTANPGCMLQLQAGTRRFSQPLPVLHVVELLDLAYRAADESVNGRGEPHGP